MNVCSWPLPLRRGVVSWLVGLVVGYLIAVLLVALVLPVFPRIQEYSRDLGLALAVRWELIRAVGSGGVQRVDKEPGYAFIDLHPGSVGTSSESTRNDAQVRPDPYEVACRQLAVADPRRSCDARHPVDRHLLADAIDKVSRLPIQSVVIDILLDAGPEPHGISGDEALREAIRKSGRTVFAAAPVVVASSGLKAGLDLAVLPPEGLPDLLRAPASGGQPLARPGVPFPVAEQPVRRYARCQSISGTGELMPTLPWAVARYALEQGAQQGRTLDCADRRTPPRIAYTLPSLDSHVGEDLSQFIDLAASYTHLLLRCTWNDLSRPGSPCSSAQAMRGRIVVIGASNPLRRDRHFTPLGDMAGSEVVINAIRSFILYESKPEPTLAWKLAGKLWVVTLVAMLVWLPFYVFRHWHEHRDSPATVRPAAKLRAVLLRFSVFAFAVVCASALALWVSVAKTPTPDVDVLVPVLAVAIEALADWLDEVRSVMRDPLERWFCTAGGSAHGQ